ncbi:MAG: glycerate kinase [Myxococcales bacterium]|nr:glycerate kinase [Myxococcales bacterium]
MTTRVLVAPDAFKGSLSAVGVAQALARGLADGWPEAVARTLPLADGGEGTLAALGAAEAGAEIAVPVTGPQGEALQAAWFHAAADGLAVVEMARASGLSVTRHRRPRGATSHGTGALIAAAAQAGATTLWVAVGGSATVDGGAGALTALGFALLDAAGEPVPPGADGLARVARIEPPDRPLACPVVVLHDVRNPLVGVEGAARVYGPQKGADAADVAQLDAGLERWGAVLAETFGRDPRALPGAGAGGGLAGGLWAALGATMRPGFEAIAARVGLDAALSEADWVWTGEGRVDAQTAFGKTVGAIAARARQPVIAFAGGVTPAAERWCPPHVALVPIVDGPRDLEGCRAEAAPLIRRAAARTARLLRVARAAR